MTVNIHISDMFFNIASHKYQQRQILLDNDEPRGDIYKDANEFLASLVALHVAGIPTVEELVEDFFRRAL